MAKFMAEKTVWSLSMQLKLIQLVRHHPAAWKDRSDVIESNRSWRIIGTALGQTPELCKLQFQSIRKSYMRSKKNFAEGRTKTLYKFAAELKFLDNDGPAFGFSNHSRPRSPNNENFEESDWTDTGSQFPLEAQRTNVNPSRLSSQAVNNEFDFDEPDTAAIEGGTNFIDLERLIMEMHFRPHLWNFHDREYHDRNRRENGWSAIAELLNAPSSACKKEWAKLVRQRRELRVQFPSGSAAKNGITWPYFDDMSFLDGVPTHRRTDSNFDYADENQSSEASLLMGSTRIDNMPALETKTASAYVNSTGSKLKKRFQRQDESTTGAYGVTTAVSTVLSEYFKNKEHVGKTKPLCPEALLVDDAMNRHDQDTKTRFRLKLFELLSNMESERTAST